MQETITYALHPCRYGLALIAFSAKGLCALFLGESAQVLEGALAVHVPRARLERTLAKKTAQDVLRAIETGYPKNHLALDLRGTPFQRRVWHALCAIPRGETRSYAEIARAIGAPLAARAVGQACGANALALVIPCHRALRSDGKISGYRWGIARKRKILRAEGLCA